jgi:uncharacterized protein
LDPTEEFFARDRDWARLTEFVDSPMKRCLLGLVYGRRRQGKTTLLRRLCAVYGGFYWQARETETTDNLASLSVAYSEWVQSPGPIRFGSWEEALRLLCSHRTTTTPVVLDEIGRVIAKVPSLPSIIQANLDLMLADGPNRTRLILCGSAFGQMRRLLDGTAPLRGRATLELVVQPFDYRTAAAFWGLESNPSAAFELFSYIGGTPAYPTFAAGDRPLDGDIRRWVLRRLLDPSSALFREGRVVVAEDEELSDQQLYWGLLGTVASGVRRWGDIDVALGTKPGSLAHALRTVIDAGWMVRREDPIRKQRASYELREPLVRFHRLVIEPNEHRLSLGLDPTRVWNDSEPLVASLIHGPQLEQLAFDWSLLYASRDTFGGTVSAIGPTALARAVADGAGGTVRDLDLAAVEFSSTGAKHILAVGEVKALTTRVGTGLLRRLDLAVGSLTARPPAGMTVAGDVKRVIVSRSGFTNELRRLAEDRPNVELVDLNRLYHGS